MDMLQDIVSTILFYHFSFYHQLRDWQYIVLYIDFSVKYRLYYTTHSSRDFFIYSLSNLSKEFIFLSLIQSRCLAEMCVYQHTHTLNILCGDILLWSSTANMSTRTALRTPSFIIKTKRSLCLLFFSFAF